MVQRKLTLQLHHAQPQSFTHHHDAAAKSSRGADLKAKKMKKSGSVKRPRTTPPPLPLCGKVAATPNYMKSTTSSDARKEQSPSPKRALSKKPSFKSARKRSPVLKSESVDAKRATCSSTLKDSKFPAFLSLNPGGHSAVKVCPYAYCSLNGRHRPPLRSFISAARLARVPAAARDDAADDDDDDDDFFVEIYTAAAQDQEERVSEEFSQDSFDGSEEFSQDSFDGSDMDWETGYGSLLHEADAVETIDESVEGKGCCSDEAPVDEAAQESVDEDGGFYSDAFSSSDDGDATDHNLQISAPPQQGNDAQGHEEAASFDALNLSNEEAVAVAVEAAGGAGNGIFTGENAEGLIALLQFAATSKKLAEEGDGEGGFNPRAPSFLPVEAGPEAERVDLRHQDLDERRNAEEWMVDYALRQVVTKLGPAKKRKVALLVEAFEKVTPLPLPLPSAKFDHHLSHASPFDQPWLMQACS